MSAISENPTQTLVRKYYEAFGFENTITSDSNQLSETCPLYVLGMGRYFPVFFNRQTGQVCVGVDTSVTELEDIETLAFFYKSSRFSFAQISLPEISKPKPEQPVIAVIKTAYSYDSYYDNIIKRQLEDAGYFVQYIYTANYETETARNLAIWSLPNIRAAIRTSGYLGTDNTVCLSTSAEEETDVELAEWLAANPVAMPV